MGRRKRAVCLLISVMLFITDFAKALISEEDTKFEDAVDTLETARKALEDDRQKLEEEKNAILRQKENAEKSLEKAKEQSEKEIDRAKREAERIVENARRAGNTLLLEIEQLKKELAKKNNHQYVETAKFSKIKLKSPDVVVFPWVPDTAIDFA